MKICWNGFLEYAIKEYPKEACAFLFSRKPYSPSEEWQVFPVKNSSTTPREAWCPARKDMIRVKSKATKLRLVKIGNIHSHPIPKSCTQEAVNRLVLPSDIDLKWGRRFNDTIRGIIAVDDKKVRAIFFHDKFGNEIKIEVEK